MESGHICLTACDSNTLFQLHHVTRNEGSGRGDEREEGGRGEMSGRGKEQEREEGRL